MTSVDIVPLVVPLAVDSPDAGDFLGLVEVRNSVMLESLGPDAVMTATELLSRFQNSAEAERIWFVAKIGDRVVGRAVCALPFDDAAPEVEIGVDVATEHRRKGIGSALVDRVEKLARERGKSIAQGFMPGPAPGNRLAISPPSGFGAVPLDHPGTAFALQRGATLAQVLRGSALALPVSDDVVTPLYRDAAAAAGTRYSIVRWAGPTPDEWLGDIATLRTRMTMDAPSGDLTITEDIWDVERVRIADAEWGGGGAQVLTSAAVDNETRHLVAFTEIVVPPEGARGANQLDTLVLTEHRGRRLGLLLKIDNLRHLQEAWPSVRRVAAANAEENRPILAVNEALGFVAVEVTGIWKLAL